MVVRSLMRARERRPALSTSLWYDGWGIRGYHHLRARDEEASDPGHPLGPAEPPERLDEQRDERRRLEEALRINKPLAVAYYLKEELRQLWEQPDQATAARFLDDWIARAQSAGMPILHRFAMNRIFFSASLRLCGCSGKRESAAQSTVSKSWNGLPFSTERISSAAAAPSPAEMIACTLSGRTDQPAA